MTPRFAFTLIQDGYQLSSLGLLSGVAILLAVYLAFTLAQRFVITNRLLLSVSLQLNVLVLTLLTVLCLKPALVHMHPYVMDSIIATSVFMMAVIGLRFCEVFLFDLVASWRKKPPTPQVLRDLVRWAFSLIALVIIIRGFFPGVNLSVLAVSSLVAGYIVGNATQDTLGNLVAGLALNTERPFQIGDWVTVGGHTGVVVNTTWRATTLRTKADDHILIPNSPIAREPITNYSRPTRCHGCYATVGVDYACPPNKVRTVILDILQSMPDVLKAPAPSVYLTGYGDSSINFTIKFFIEDFAMLDPIQSQVMDRLWYAFKRNGITIPFPIRDVRMRNNTDGEGSATSLQRQSALEMITGIELFGSLSVAEREKLVDAIVSVPYATGETLCREGEAGDSFYIIRSGKVVVSIAGANGNAMPMAHLGPGAFFGEMSLLTGEARSATATAETDVEVLRISKENFAGLLQADSELAGKLAATLEKRAAEQQAKMATVANQSTPLTQSNLVNRIRRFFDLG